MLPSLFSVALPATGYQILFSIYCYLLPILLYCAWAALSLMDLFASPREERGSGWGFAVIALPLVGGAAYLLARARNLEMTARVAIVVGGLLVWLIPLAYGLSLSLGPLGPKALT